MKAKILVYALPVLILTTIHLADTQQPGKVPRIGYLSSGSPSATTPEFREAFRQGLRDLGYVEGKSILIEYRWAEGKFDRVTELAAELVRLKVDIILAPNSGIARAAKKQPAPFLLLWPTVAIRSEMGS